MVRARRLRTRSADRGSRFLSGQRDAFPIPGRGVRALDMGSVNTHRPCGSLREPLMSERGQVTVMALGLALMSLVMAGLAVDGTKAFLLRRTLQNAADSASLAGAGEIDGDAYYGSGGKTLELSPEEAVRTAEVSGVPADRSPGVVEGRRGRRECRPEGKIRNPLPRACRDLRGARRGRKQCIGRCR